MPRRFTIKQVVTVTGLEESEVRYFEQVFSEFLTFSKLEADRNLFNEDHVELLTRIRDLVRGQGLSTEEVKRELKSALRRGEPNGPVNGKSNGHRNGQSNAPSADVIELPAGNLTPYGQPRRRFARVISVTSGKGGVGKTTVSVNLAIAFAQMGKRVAIFDADLGLANVHILMGIKPRFNMRHVIEDNFSLEDVVAEGPLGIKVISGGQGVREMANLTAEQRRVMLRQLDLLERNVDILLIDTGAGISDNVLRFATFADEIVVVTTPNIAAAADGYSIIKILLQMEPKSRIGVICNQVKNMYHSKNVFNRINTAAAKYLKAPLGDLGYIIEDNHVSAANQIRKPFMLEYQYSEAAQCVKAIAETILHDGIFRNERKDSCFEDLMGALKRTVVGV